MTFHHTEQWNALREKQPYMNVVPLIDCLVEVQRLRMISVFTGFRRETHKSTAIGNRLVRPDILGNCDWLPANELFGEGIFFSLSDSFMKQWEIIIEESRTKDRQLNRYLNDVTSCDLKMPEVSKTPRFVLCHTLSHLLIRQLERNCGYPIASLQERIYCSNWDQPMAGILIFVAVPDKYGSLGGLMEYAEPLRFHQLVSKALETARWCSFDPVCCNPEENKRELLNGAACHACLMIPESSCCCNNQFLDRILINGTNHLPSLLELLSPQKYASA